MVGNFRIWVLGGKTPQTMRFAIEHPIKEAVYNCWQFPYLDFILVKHQTKIVWKWNIGIRKLPTNVGSL